MTIYEFLAEMADYMEVEAEGIDNLGREQTQAHNWIGVAHCWASAETMRAIARAYRRSIPTEEHEWDYTQADLAEVSA